ncbi:WD40-repeat-containing domain protein [Radiomyces spectabilis]|uniref:WD40-repeat-containing domain protein n=1 Tax=Radiomyces spectabilis TaxID=64574 RepID=UPI00221FF0A2|nr:WD40-repeat-containing domain protein [Radiomyces spectabilis]KAI8372785.1 WD40-repeat-containing domain protein [Radiomyces spectabilis]
MSEADQAHATVLRFLVHHGYGDTAEAFIREAGARVDPSVVINADIPDDIFNDDAEETRLAEDVARHLSLHASGNPRNANANELAEGDDDYYTTLTKSMSSIHESNIIAVAIAPQTHLLATGSTDKSVKICNPKDSNDILHSYTHHTAPVMSIEFHPIYPQYMLTTSMDGTAVLANIENEQSIECQRFKDHQKYIVRGIFSKDGQFMATASYDRTICIYKTTQDVQYTLLKRLGPFLGNVETICFLDSSVLVAGIRDDNYLHYIHLPDLRHEKYNMNANGDDWVSFSPLWLSASPDGQYLLCSTDHVSGRMILFETHSARQVQNYYDKPTDDNFVMRRHCWHASGRYFYTAGADAVVHVIEAKTGRVVHRLTGHKNMVRTMAMDPDLGLVTGGYDHCVNVWNKPINNILNR